MTYLSSGAALAVWQKMSRKLGLGAPISILMMLCIVGMLVFELRRSYQSTTEDAERSVQNLTRVLAEQTERTFQSIDLTLQTIVDELQDNRHLAPNDLNFRGELLRRLGALPYVRALFVIGPDGFIVHDTDYPATPRVSLADRPYFSVHKNNPLFGLQIAKPLRSRSLGIWFAALTRRIEDSEGGFNGVVVAAVEPLYFEQFYRQLWVGDGTIALFLQDGTLLARSPKSEDAMTKSFHSVEPFRSQLGQKPQGYDWSTSPIDGVERVAGYQKLKNVPLVVLVTVNAADALQPWISHAVVLVIGAAILLVVLATLEWLSREHHRREELAIRQLAQGQRLETVGRFSSGLAHDLGNLERVVRSAVLLLRPAVKDQIDAVNILDEIDFTLASARDMIRQLLAYARSNELRPEPVELNALIAASLSICRRAAGPGIEVTVSPGRVAATCLIDAIQMQAALVNLIINSRDAMPAGGTIWIDLHVVEPGTDQPWAQVTVRDQGGGMSPDVLKHAFDPFFTTKKREQGNGLGLAQVRDFVIRSGGQIEISSIEGQGVSVRLRLPLTSIHSPQKNEALGVIGGGVVVDE